MIKNKTLNINFIFKIYLKILKYDKNILDFQIDFYFRKLLITVFKYYSQKLFWTIGFKQIQNINTWFILLEEKKNGGQTNPKYLVLDFYVFEIFTTFNRPRDGCKEEREMRNNFSKSGPAYAQLV